jgi:hypothetical protein
MTSMSRRGGLRFDMRSLKSEAEVSINRGGDGTRGACVLKRAVDG